MRLNIQLFADGKVIIGTEMDTSGVDDGIEEINKKISEFQERSEKRWAEPLEEWGKKTEDIGEEVKQVNFNVQELSQHASKIDKKISGIVKGIGKWALRLIGIRSIYALISNAASHLEQTNKETKKDLDYMKMVVATAFEPVITAIVGWLKTMLSYVNAIYFRLTGKDLFKEASKNLESGAKSAKSIKKSLASFDEMNVLSDTSSGGAAGGSSYGANFPKPEDVEIPSWMQWIVDNKQFVVDGLLGIAMGLTAVKLGLSGLMGVGIGLIAFGLTELIRDMTNPKTDGLKKAVKFFGDLLIIIGGIVTLFNPLYGIAIALIGFVVKYLPEISNWISNLEDKIANGIIKWLERLKTQWTTTWGVIKQDFMMIWQAIVGTWQNAKAVYLNFINGLEAGFIRFMENLSSTLERGRDWIDRVIIGGLQKLFSNLWNGITSGIQAAVANAKNTITNFWGAIKKLFSKGGDIFNGFKDGISSTFKSIVNLLITGINKVIKTPLDAVNKMLNKIHDANILGVAPFKNLWSRNPIKIPVIPKLAKGGIINMPGRGTLVGSAIAGESGREAVLPLTDSQQMELLGEAIGRYITINANITNTMNGRIISRELQRIQNENNFAGNR